MKPKREIVKAKPEQALDRATPPKLTASDVENLEEVLEHVDARNTKRAYESDWRMFRAFCESRSASALPAHPAVVVAYLTALAKGEIPDRHGKPAPRKISTVERHLATISTMHTRANLASPWHRMEVRVVMQGLRRTIGAPQKSKTAAVDEILYRMVRGLPNDVRRTRNAAILLVGFFGALRRSELVAIDIEHITPGQGLLSVLIPKSKGDQEGKGQRIELIANPSDPSLCPVTIVKRLREEVGSDTGPLFCRMGRDGTHLDRLRPGHVAKIVKAGAERLGLDPKSFAGHSLRSGFATSAKLAGADVLDIRHQTRHKSLEQLSKYIQNVVSAEDHAATKIIRRSR